MKDNKLIATLLRELRLARDEARRARAEADAARTEARTDPLTQLGNRRAWTELTERLQASGETFTVLLFDLANLKAANTALGHEGANELLARVADCIRSEGDLAVRLGGDEFAVILPRTTAAQALVVRDRIEQRVGIQTVARGAPVFLAGDATTWAPGRNLASLMDAADKSLERRKRALKLSLGAPAEREALEVAA